MLMYLTTDEKEPMMKQLKAEAVYSMKRNPQQVMKGAMVMAAKNNDNSTLKIIQYLLG
jgi:hypothetical protein